MLSLQEKTAERSPPESAPEGTAMTSASRPASSIDRWAFSLPAQSSMQPNGRTTEVVHSKVWGSTFLNFIAASCQHVQQSSGVLGVSVLRSLLDTWGGIWIHEPDQR